MALTRSDLCVDADSNIRLAMELMNSNCLGVVFVTEAGRLVGVVSDGDFRRAVLESRFASLDDPVRRIMNPSPSALSVGSGAEETYLALAAGVAAGIKVFPRIDDDRVVHGFSYQEDWGLIPLAEPQLTGNEAVNVMQCLRDNWISSSGPFVAEFESSFAELTGLRNPVAVSNGTVAITLAIQALGVSPGDEFIVPSATFAATANAVVAAGAVPVFADVDPDTWGLSPVTVEPLLSSRTRGVIAVHLYGYPCDVAGLRSLCDRNGLLLIEDCAEAIGTRTLDAHAGSFADAATFSFFGNKTLTTGEGGMVLFADDSARVRAKQLRDHGMSTTRRYWHDVVGFNYRLTNLQAAIGVAQVERADVLISHKVRSGRLYDRLLSSVPGIEVLPVTGMGQPSYWLFPVLLDEEIAGSRDVLMETLATHGIQTRVTFPALHRMPAFSAFDRPSSLAVSETIEARGLCLPNTPNMSDESVEFIVATLSDSILRAEGTRV